MTASVQPLMQYRPSAPIRAAVALFLIIRSALICAADVPVQIDPDWAGVGEVLKTNVALQVCPEPPMYRGNALHHPIYLALQELKADYNRFQPWSPYPRLAVAELKPPDGGKTFWDFSLMDQIVEDFVEAVGERPVVFSINTIPKWMSGDTPVRGTETDRD